MMSLFQEFIIHEYRLLPKAVLFGFSRGGLYAFNYTAAYPQNVDALYLDAPVLDIRSWPGGMGKGTGSTKEWLDCMEIYGLDAEAVKEFKSNPLNKADKVAKAGIPVIIVAGDADTAVPFEENSAILVREYESFGGRIKLILKKGVGHHPHSLEDPSEIVKTLIQEFC